MEITKAQQVQPIQSIERNAPAPEKPSMRVVLTNKERILKAICIILTLGYYRYHQNKAFEAAVAREDLKGAESAIRNGSRNYLGSERVSELLTKQGNDAIVSFLFDQAQFGKTLNSSGKEILKLVQKVEMYNYTTPCNRRLLKLFLEHSPLEHFVTDYGKGYLGKQGNARWDINPVSDGDPVVSKEEFLKCRLLANIWLRSTKEAQQFFKPTAIESLIKTNPAFGLFSVYNHDDFTAAVSLWLSLGLDPNLSRPTQQGNAVETLLGHALHFRRYEAAEALIKAGANPNTRSRTEFCNYYTGYEYQEGTPLEFAIRHSQMNIVQELLARGATPTKQALEACLNHKGELWEQLFLKLATHPQLPPNSIDSQILDTAMTCGRAAPIDFLLKRGLVPREEIMETVAIHGDMETAAIVLRHYPHLATERILQRAIDFKKFDFVRWLVGVQPALKTTASARTCLDKAKRIIAAETALVEALTVPDAH